MESKRNFLKSLDCVEELLILEEESGNFNEAAEIAKSLGDILREADLLEKAGDCLNASLLIISYVFFNSLWLKSFPQKEELLTKAMSVAEKVGGTFYSTVCAEADVITSHDTRGLSALMQSYIASKQYQTYSSEVLYVRKLLDAHVQVHPSTYEQDPELHDDPKLFDEKISRNQVSCRTLVHIWNLRKASISRILDCLDSLEETDTAQFCFNYFGVRPMHKSSDVYLLLKPDAAWVDKRFVVKNRNVMTLEARHFASAAGKYWRQELVSTGLTVLEALQSLHRSYAAKPSSVYCRCLCLTCIYEVTRFLIDTNSLDMKQIDGRRAQGFLQLSTKYFELVFPLDTRQSLSKNLVSLRETEISKNLLEEIISRNVSSRNVLTYGQIGRVVTMLMGSGKPKHDLCKKIAERLGANSPWKPFIMNLTESVSSLELHSSLEDSFYDRWRVNDPISPDSFFYLTERLLLSIPHPQGLVFASKSCFVECLMCLPSDADPSSVFLADNDSYPQEMIQLIVKIVHQCLYNTAETKQWIRRCHVEIKYYFPVLMLRLFSILCCLCMNSHIPFNLLFRALSAPQIRSELSTEFCKVFSRKKNDMSSSYSDMIARAFKIIGNPLVAVSSSGSFPEFASPDAVFVDLTSFSCRNEIMEILFPETEYVQSENNMTESISTEPPPVVCNPSHSENAKGNMQIKWALIREMSEALELLSNTEDDGELERVVLKKKVEVLEHMKFLISARAQLGEQQMNNSREKDENVTCVFGELSKICHLLDTSEGDFKAQSKVIGELLTSLGARSFKVDALLSQLTSQIEPNASAGTEDLKNSYSIPVTEDGHPEDLNADDGVSKKGDECSHGKKKKKKSKKGKANRKK